MSDNTEDVCELFVGYRVGAVNVQGLFEETEEFQTASRDESIGSELPPNCLAAKLLGFDWYDHDRLDYEMTETPLPPKEFFSQECVQRIAQHWKVPSLSQLAECCEKLESGSINFIVHIGAEYLQIPPGKKAIIDGKEFIMYLGDFKR